MIETDLRERVILYHDGTISDLKDRWDLFYKLPTAVMQLKSGSLGQM